MSSRLLNLSHKIIPLSLVLFFIFVGGVFWFIQNSIKTFKYDEIRNNMSWIAQSVIYFCSTGDDQLGRIGAAEDKVLLNLKKAETLEFIEDFIKKNDYKIIVADYSGQTVLSSFDQDVELIAEDKDSYKPYQLHEVQLDNEAYAGYLVTFDPWKWKLSFYRGYGSYDNLLKQVREIYIIFGVLLFTVAIFCLLFFRQLIDTQRVLKESEWGMKATLDALTEGVLVLDDDGTIIQINPSAIRMLGLEEKNRVVGKPAHEVLHIRALQTGKPITQASFKGGRLLNVLFGVHDEYEMIDKQRNVKKVRLSGASYTILQEGKSRRQQVLSLVDITILKDTEKKLSQAQRMETVGLMAGGVAHDLNNSLSGIVTYPQLLLMKLPKDSEMRKPLQAIFDSGKRAANVVDDLLTVARGAASSREIVNLNNLLEDYLASPEHKKIVRDYPNISFNLDLDESLPNISCSEVHVNKCIMNLLINGVESIEDRGVCRLQTRKRYLDEAQAHQLNVKPGDYASLLISDSGKGIGNADVQHIFEPFYTKKKMGKSGTGLGLAVVWNTMQDHKGTVTVSSTDGLTEFVLYFPVTSRPATKLEDKVQIGDILGDQQAIMIVDDDISQLEITSAVLETLNYTPICMNSGEEALEFLSAHNVDVVILDMVMDPGISGYETYRRMIELKPEQKAIVVSGYSRSEDVVNSLELGAQAFVKKPYSMEQLGMALKKVV